MPPHPRPSPFSPSCSEKPGVRTLALLVPSHNQRTPTTTTSSSSQHAHDTHRAMGCCTSICCCCRGGRCATWRDAGDPAAAVADVAAAEPDASATAAAAAEARRGRAEAAPAGAAAFHPFGLTAEGQARQPDNHEEGPSPQPEPSVNSVFEPTEPTAGAEPPSTVGSLNFLTFDDVATTTIVEAESTEDDTPHHYSDVSPCPSPSINHDLLVNDSFVSAASQQIHIPRLDVSSAQKAKQIRLYNRKITHVATLAAEAEAEAKADAKAAAAAATVAAVNEAASSTATTPVPGARRFPSCLLNLNNHLGFTTPSSAVYTSPAVSDSSSSSSTTSGPGESSYLSSTSSSLAVVGCLAYEETEPTPTTGGDRRPGVPPRGTPPPRPPHHHARSCSLDAAAAAATATATATATAAGTRPFHRRVFSEGCDGDFARGATVPQLLPPAPFAARQEGTPLAASPSPSPQLSIESPASPPLLTRTGGGANADFAEKDECRSSSSPFPEN